MNQSTNHSLSMSKRPLDEELPAAKRVEHEWLCGNVRSEVLRFAARSDPGTCQSLMTSGLVTVYDIYAARKNVPRPIHDVISTAFRNALISGADHLLYQVGTSEPFDAVDWGHFMNGKLCHVIQLPTMVNLATRDEARRALVAATKERNVMLVWYLFRRMHERRENISLVAETLRDWIWSDYPNWRILVRAYPMQREWLWPMMTYAHLSPRLVEGLRLNPDFDDACWKMLVEAVTENSSTGVTWLLAIGTPLYTEPNLVHLAAKNDYTESLTALLNDTTAARAYAPEALTMERRRFMMSLRIARAAWCTIS